MVRMSRAAGRALGLLAMLDAACVFEFDADYAGTRYVCEADQACPDGFSCVNGSCVDAPPADFADDAAGGGFEAGTFSATENAGDHVRLIEGATEGTFRSRVFDSGIEDADTFFVDPGGTTGPTVQVDLDGVRGRYFQYLVTLTGIAAADGSPELHAVRLGLAP
jgi:hypothetical protein